MLIAVRSLASLVLLMKATVAASSFSAQVSIEPAGRPQAGAGIDVLGAVELARSAPDGFPVTGLSALGWDEDEQLLYAVSDRGSLLHLRPRFEGDRLSGIDHVAGFRLRGPDGHALRGKRIDAEGLVLRNGANGRPGDSELIISFEQLHRVHRFSTKGGFLGETRIPGRLQDRGRYRNGNKGLEALADHPVYGLMTAPEAGLTDDAEGAVSLSDMDGRIWSYTPAAIPGSAVVSIEALEDGRLVVLERAFVSLFRPLVVSLRVVEPGAGLTLGVTTLAMLDGADGWAVENFEGLANHRCDRFFMVSDDNGNEFQRTLLVYLRLPGLMDP